MALFEGRRGAGAGQGGAGHGGSAAMSQGQAANLVGRRGYSAYPPTRQHGCWCQRRTIRLALPRTSAFHAARADALSLWDRSGGREHERPNRGFPFSGQTVNIAPNVTASHQFRLNLNYF
jgi:hypothetical protein